MYLKISARLPHSAAGSSDLPYRLNVLWRVREVILVARESVGAEIVTV